MSEEEGSKTKIFFAERAKTGRSACKKCKQKIDAGALRLGKAGYNAFGPEPMKMWYHPDCLFEVFSHQRSTTARINSPDDIEAWEALKEEDKEALLKLIPDITADVSGTSKVGSSGSTAKKRSAEEQAGPSPKFRKMDNQERGELSGDPGHKDNSLDEFTRLLQVIRSDSTYTGKTAIIHKFLNNGTDGDKFKGDVRLWVKLLLPGVIKRKYHLRNLQLVNLFSKIFCVAHDHMLELLEQGDIAETIVTAFSLSKRMKPESKSTLTLQEVDSFLESLTKVTKGNDQEDILVKLTKRCTIADLKTIICLIKGDLRIYAGAKHVFGALHRDAHSAFMKSQDLEKVFSVIELSGGQPLSVDLEVLKGVQPMLAEPCQSVEYAMKKFPNGMYAEVKYDGERVQVHKKGNTFKYYSRALKPVSANKVSLFSSYIPHAFPTGVELILDAEVLLMDTKTGKPLPFGTLGVHKRQAFQDSSVCLFVFDCLFFNGASLLNMPMKKRREILHQVMTEIPNHIMFSEAEEIYTSAQLQSKIAKTFQLGLEGVVLKGFETIYEPNKRRWLKVKKDYLNDGAMADTADLVVLGAWYGTGHRGGMMSTFLMGCWNPSRKVWIPVTNVATGLDQKTLARIQSELKMTKISKNAELLPDWLQGPKKIVPDFIATDPKNMPVWEITGAEFSKTPDGISIRFPRVKRFRDDKTWKTATNFRELQMLYEKSKDSSSFSLPPSSSDQQSKAAERNVPGNGADIKKYLTKSPAKEPEATTSKAGNKEISKRSSHVNREDKTVGQSDKHDVANKVPENETNIKKCLTNSPVKKPEPGCSIIGCVAICKPWSNLISEHKIVKISKHDGTSKRKCTTACDLMPPASSRLQMPGYDVHLMKTCETNFVSDPLHRSLEGCTFFICKALREKYIPAILLLGGSIVQLKYIGQATHVIYGSRVCSLKWHVLDQFSAGTYHLYHKWLAASVAKGEIQDITKYLVMLHSRRY